MLPLKKRLKTYQRSLPEKITLAGFLLIGKGKTTCSDHLVSVSDVSSTVTHPNTGRAQCCLAPNIEASVSLATMVSSKVALQL